MRPIFCGNFDFDARSSDLERLFRRYGKVDRVDMKSGFAFVYMDDERDAEYAIRALDRSEFGRKGRRLRVEWTKHERAGRKPVSTRRSAISRPSKTLFVINFPYETKTRDLERHFDPYGKIVNVRIRRNFAFVQYESLEDATKALDATNLSKLMDRVISVEYAARDDDEKRGGYSPDRRGRDRSPNRRRRSPSPYKKERGSPDYGTGASPVGYNRRERGSPEYGNRSSRSPRRVQRSPEYGNRSSRSPRRVRSPGYGNGSNRSPRQTSRNSPPYNRARSSSPRHEERRSPPVLRDRSRSPRAGERNGNGYAHRPSSSPYPEEGAISDDVQEPRSPMDKPVPRDSPIGEYGSPVDDRYRSPSPPVRDRSQS